MVIINTSATEVSIHAGSPLSRFGAAAPAAAAGAAAAPAGGAAGAGVCARAEQAHSATSEAENMARWPYRYRDLIYPSPLEQDVTVRRVTIVPPSTWAL